MTSRLRLAEWPFLAATLAMGLALVLPWAFTPPAEEQTVELAEILPWAVPERAAVPQIADAVQVAGQTSATSRDVALR